MSCDADIPPAFVHSIQTNVCAGCGGEVMNQAAKEMLDELTDAMERMPNDPQGVAGWLLSNYKLVKVGERVEPTEEFHRKRSAKRNASSVEDDDRNLAIADNTVQKFLKRTGQAGRVAENNAKLAALAKQIKAGPSEEQYGDIDSHGEDVDGDFEEDYTPPVASAKKTLANNVMIGAEGDEPLSPEETAKLMKRVADSGSKLDTGAQALQMQRMDRLARQQGVADGTGPGTFRRGG